VAGDSATGLTRGRLALPRIENHLRAADVSSAWRRSASKTAERMFCHPNTVWHRLRRIEEHTGRSLTDPLDTSELCVALQTERRLPASETGAWPRTVHG
jgi:hypothetical protein